MHNMNSEDMANMAKTFEVCTNIKCKYIELETSSAYEPVQCSNQLCCTLHKLLKQDYSCKELTMHAYEQAQRFGLAYIYYCDIGLVHIIMPIHQEDGKKRAFFCGPILISDKYEYLFEEIAIKYKISTNEIQTLLKALDDIDAIEPYKVTALSNMIELVANQASTDIGKLNVKIRNDVQKQQIKIHEYLLSENVSTNDTPRTYSIEKEKLLIAAIRDCDIEKARELLNSILGDLFVIAVADLDTIRTRLVELIVLLSRGAVEGGVSTKEIFGLNGQYIKQVLEVDTIDDLYFCLNQILIRFVDAVFVYRNSRHGDSIKRAIQYIKQNYMNKITLEEVASAVHVSPNYFSKIFKEESGINFATYLNQIRIEGAKKLLAADETSLADVAYLAGFEDQSYFSRVFKKYTGLSPKRYKELKGSS
ncbi:helix-turn-helix domain-containing protein [Cellulosilyticum sp. I15G10I2]|uniref:helix-turn-helix domain-containing protein n=1 Tax=Cellulosilyticum sp. I15G10I2 TaxID=1892843 RepID=UPI00085CAE6F|nr:helix-turn-helix domain-containing protein [Cellulosilyticum sp. I15G10I2]